MVEPVEVSRGSVAVEDFRLFLQLSAVGELSIDDAAERRNVRNNLL
jgi:hypothetical protein